MRDVGDMHFRAGWNKAHKSVHMAKVQEGARPGINTLVCWL